MNYYNEFDPNAAQWLRNLIAAGLIPAGDVDERSIEDVRPNDLRGYTQCHFFSGIGGWPLALAIAGWPVDRPVWTGSCPCQPFSAAGKGDGFADQRHLWPAWFHLIRECRPNVVFGEQVAAAIRFGWLDLVSADLEAEDYAIGGAVLGAHSVGAPHIRQRLYFVAESVSNRAGRNPGSGDRAQKSMYSARNSDGYGSVSPWACCPIDKLADSSSPRLAQQFGERGTPCEATGGPAKQAAERASASVSAVVQSDRDGSLARDGATATAGRSAESAGFWSGAEWIGCRDGKARPVEPGIQPLAHGVSARVVRLRAYGNAIVPQTAAAFVMAFVEVIEMERREAA